MINIGIAAVLQSEDLGCLHKDLVFVIHQQHKDNGCSPEINTVCLLNTQKFLQKMKKYKRNHKKPGE